MTPFVQRLGLRTAQERALQNPLAWSPFPVAAVSQGPDWGISSQAYTIGCTGLQQPRQRPGKGNNLVSHELRSCPSCTETQRGHPVLPPWSAFFRPWTWASRKEKAPRSIAAVYTAQGPRTIWLCVLVCSTANIPLSYQHLLKPRPISFSA